MSEHHDHDHLHHHTTALEESDTVVPAAHVAKTENPARLIAGSVLLSAILICASIFYNTSLIVKNMGSGTAMLGSGNQVLGTGAQPTPQAQPSGPVSVADRSDEPVLGNKNAKVTMVEFADFQCPFCKQYYTQNFSEIKSKYVDTGKVKLVFRHFPLTQIHVNAQISAVAAECANQQGKFWEYHDLLYTNGSADGTNLDKTSLEKYADQLGLNNGSFGFGKNKFNQCLESNATLATVNKDEAEGAKDGVTGTPTFYINGKQIVGAQPLQSFETALDAALQ